MKATVKISAPSLDAADVLIVPLGCKTDTKKRGTGKAAGAGNGAVVPMTAALRALDRSLGGIVGAALESGDFRGRAGQTAVLYPPKARGGSKVRRVIVVGLGPEGKQSAETLRRAAGSAIQRARPMGAQRVSLKLPKASGVAPEQVAQALTEGIVLGSYSFEQYRESAKHKPLLALTLYADKAPAARLTALRRAATAGLVIAESQNVARDLSNEPGNELPPAELAKTARKIARESGLRCTVMDVAELKRRKMGGVLAVGQGSSRPPRVIVLEHGTARGRRPTICLIGKGITFDSGGISIKPAASMDEMKHDMGGAAAVIGAMRAIATLDLPLHVVAVIASAENMPSGTAYRPGDIIKSHSGKTIEVLNTDAEGRIVLADALHYAVTRWKPEAMLDLATLTGACQVALGPWASGLLGNDEALVEKVRVAGEASGERAWPLPLFDEHKRAMVSTVADLKNTGGRHAGASTAAGFLSAFVGDTPWVHLDIAGTGWTSAQGPYQPRGGTGVGVRILLELLRSWK